MPRVKTGGRQKGTRNKITDAHRLAIHRACREIGSGRALVGGSRSDPLTRFYVRAWQAEPATFLSKVLPAVLPPPMPREANEESDATPPNADSLFNSARRIAFLLALAQHEQEARTTDVEMVGLSPASQAPEPPAPYRPALDELPEQQDPLPAPAPPTSENLETFRGSAAEQGRARHVPDVIDQRSQAHQKYVSHLAEYHRRSLL